MINKKEIDFDSFDEEVIYIRRVTKVVKGGRNLRFSVLMGIGDGKGLVGIASASAKEIPMAIKKAIKKARKNVFEVPIVNGTLPHYTEGKKGAGHVILRPASKGTGVIAGSSVRIILELAGVDNVLTKIVGSKNPITSANATIQGLKNLKTQKDVEIRKWQN